MVVAVGVSGACRSDKGRGRIQKWEREVVCLSSKNNDKKQKNEKTCREKGGTKTWELKSQ